MTATESKLQASAAGGVAVEHRDPRIQLDWDERRRLGEDSVPNLSYNPERYRGYL